MGTFSYRYLEEIAEIFLRRHNPQDILPVPIEKIVEINLNIRIVPKHGLKKIQKIDGFLTADLTEIHIDYDEYIRKTNRYRFSLAHEVGHYLLHRSFIQTHVSLELWREKMLNNEALRVQLENEANNFAGCILMPRRQFLLVCARPHEKSHMIDAIVRKFAVSRQAADIRLAKSMRGKNRCNAFTNSSEYVVS